MQRNEQPMLLQLQQRGNEMHPHSCNTQPRSRSLSVMPPHPRRLAASPLLLLPLVATLLLFSLAKPAAAQMSAERMHTHPVDWSSPRVIVMLAVALPMLPIYLIGLVLLIRRRKMFPIAGRGALILIIFCLSSLVNTLISMALHIAFPHGLPCALHVMPGWAFAPFMAGLLVRGWILVFRVEIQNFLAELAWRQSKKAQLQEREQTRPHTAAGPLSSPQMVLAASTTPLSPPRSILVRVQPHSDEPGAETAPTPVDSFSAESVSLEPATIPGYFFITHRRLTEPRLIIALLVLTSALLTGMVAIVALFDPDIGFTNSWRSERGLPADGLESHYKDGAFWDSPRCFTHSIKMSAFHWSMLFVMPLIFFFVWRIAVHTERTKRRAAEQAAFALAMAVEVQTPGEGSGGGGGGAGGPTRGRASSTAELGGVKSSDDDSGAMIELNELGAVKREMAIAALVGLCFIAIFVLQTAFNYDWAMLPLTGLSFSLFSVTCAWPLRISFVVSRRHREMMARARQYGTLSVNGRLVARVSHHQAWYRLAHLLHDAHAYPVLLKFLQKEYSSENALFYHEAARFARFCKKLERALPAWAEMVEEWDESGEGTAGGERGAERTITLVHSIARPGTSAESVRRSPLQQKHSLALPQQGWTGSAPSTPPLHAAASPTPTSPSITMGAVYPALPDSPSPTLVPAASLTITDKAGGAVPGSLHPSSASASSSSSVELQPQQWQGVSRLPSATLTSTCWAQPAQPRSPGPAAGRALVTGSGTWEMQLQAPNGTGSSLAPRAQPGPGPVARVHSSSRNAQPSLMRCNSSMGPSSSVFQSPASGPRMIAVSGPSPGPIPALPSSPAKPRRAIAAATAANKAPQLSFRQMHEQASHARQWALQLYLEYLKPNAVYQINIGSDLRSLVRDQIRLLRQWQPTPLTADGQPDFERAAMESAPPPPPPFPLSALFRQSGLSVFSLMETDSFRRFLLTPDFEQLLQRADDAEMERLEKQTAASQATQAVLQQADAALKLAAVDEQRTPRVLWGRLQAGLLPGTPLAQSPPITAHDDTAPTHDESDTEESNNGMQTPQPIDA